MTECGGRADSSAFIEGLLAYRATPRDGGLSSGQLVFGRMPRTRVPQLPEARLPQKTVEEHVEKTAKVAADTKARYDASAKDLPPLGKGKRVYVQSEQDGRWRKWGTVVQIGGNRDYVVEMDDGGKVRHNRRKLRLTTDVEGLDQLQGRSSSPSPSSSTSTSSTASKAAKRSTTKKRGTSSVASAPPRRSKRVAFRPDYYKE